MEKVLSEFRIIETDDGFRIEIKGDKEALREYVMSLDPRQWTPPGPGGPGFGPGFVPRMGRMFRFGGFGPRRWAEHAEAWMHADEDGEESGGEMPHHKHKHKHGHGWHHGRGPDHAVDDVD